MKILVTGATGFLGSNVINELLKHDQEILATSTDEDKAKEFSWYSLVKFIQFDYYHDFYEIDFFREMDEPDILIHLAWKGLPNYKSLFHFEKNLFFEYEFLNNIIKHGLKQAVVAGTCFEYGKIEGCLSEDMITDPQNPYALAKDTLRRFLQEFEKTHPFVLQWVRLFYMYGEGQNPNSLFPQLDLALENGEKVFNMSGGEQLRDYLPVEKVAEYIVKIALQNKICGIINCCSGKPVKVKDLVEDYLQKRNKTIQLNPGYYPYTEYEAMSFWGDDTKLKKIINE